MPRRSGPLASRSSTRAAGGPRVRGAPPAAFWPSAHRPPRCGDGPSWRRMKCRAKRVHAPRLRPLFTRVLHAARSPSTQRRSRPPFTRFCSVHALCSRIYRPVHAHRSRIRCTRSRAALTRSRGPAHRSAELVAFRSLGCRPVSWLLLRGPAWSATTTAPAADARRTGTLRGG